MTLVPAAPTIASLLVSLLTGLAACAGNDAAVDAHDGPMNLFTTIAEPDPAPAVAGEAWAVRVAAVGLNARVFADEALGVGDTFVVELFDTERFLATVTATDVVVGQRNIRARVVEPEGGGDVLLSVGRETAVGSIRIPGREHHYYLRHAPDIRSHVLIEVDPTREDVLPEAPPEEWP